MFTLPRAGSESGEVSSPFVPPVTLSPPHCLHLFSTFLALFILLAASLDGSALIGERSAALRPQPEHQSLSSALALVGTESETDFSSVTQIRPGTVTLLSVMADRNKKLSS